MSNMEYIVAAMLVWNAIAVLIISGCMYKEDWPDRDELILAVLFLAMVGMNALTYTAILTN